MIVPNKKASFDYELHDIYEAGVVLTGAETKSFFENRINLTGSYIKFIGGEPFLINSNFTWPQIPPDKQSRSRKVLLKKSEILSIKTKMSQKNLSLIPVSMYSKGRFIKLKIALGKGKKEYEKREKVKKHDIILEAERDYRAKLR